MPRFTMFAAVIWGLSNMSLRTFLERVHHRPTDTATSSSPGKILAPFGLAATAEQLVGSTTLPHTPSELPSTHKPQSP